MELFILIFFAILGILIGSFLNVVILRFNTGAGIDGRSGCMTCGKGLKWYELVPVLSYVAQNGKCGGCKSKISKQYILVELLTGLLFTFIAARVLFPLSEAYSIVTAVNLTISLVAACLLVVMFVYDMRHKIIPDIFSYGFAFMALMRLVLYYQGSVFTVGLFDFLAGPLVALPFAAVWYFSKGKWMGLGDAKLALGIGWFLGLAGAISAMCLAFWTGAAIGVALIMFARRKSHLSMKSEIPFAPFLILGLLVVYFFPMDIFLINTLLFS